MTFDVELTSTPITSTAGLAFIGKQLAEQKFHTHLASVCPQPRRNDRIPDIDTLRSMIGLVAVGKPRFDAIGDYSEEPFFKQALHLQRLPSAETLRQRIQTMPEQLGDVLRNFTIRRLRQNQDLLGQRLYGTDYSVVHVDVSPMDNSDTQKEGVSYTYKNFTGYAPIFAYIAPFGFMLNNELREGSSHCNCQGTRSWLEQTLAMAENVAPHRRLLVTDAGHDSADNLQMLDQTCDTDFLVKRNLRKEDPNEWLELAKRQSVRRQKETGDPIPVPENRHRCTWLVWRATAAACRGFRYSAARHVPGNRAVCRPRWAIPVRTRDYRGGLLDVPGLDTSTNSSVLPAARDQRAIPQRV